MPYSLAILWRDRSRYLAAILAVAFSAVLIAVQCGLVLGLLQCVSVPIDNAPADIWVLARDAASLSHAYPIPESWQARLAAQPEIVRTEPYLIGPGTWHQPGKGSSEICHIVGTQLEENSLGMVRQISPATRKRLAEPGAVVVDEWDLPNLGIARGIYQQAEVNHHRVNVVDWVYGFQGHNFMYVFCSMETARHLIPGMQNKPGVTMALLGKCKNPEDVAVVVERLRELYPDMGVHSREEFSFQARAYWLFRSTGGTVMICTMVLALLVGSVVTSQTLYAAVLASLREYAVLDALGIPRWRMALLVLSQSFWIGALGIVMALPVVWLLSWIALLFHTRIIMPPGLLLLTTGLTLGMALISGLSAMRPLRQVEPAALLR